MSFRNMFIPKEDIVFETAYLDYCKKFGLKQSPESLVEFQSINIYEDSDGTIIYDRYHEIIDKIYKGREVKLRIKGFDNPYVKWLSHLSQVGSMKYLKRKIATT